MVNVAVLSYYTLYLRYEMGSQPILFYIIIFHSLIYHACTYTSIPKLFKKQAGEAGVYSSIESYSVTEKTVPLKKVSPPDNSL
jgi:hypothetical protein